MNRVSPDEKPAANKPKKSRTRGAMGSALSASIDAETNSFQARLQKAEKALQRAPREKSPIKETTAPRLEEQGGEAVPDTEVVPGRETRSVPEVVRVVRDA